VGFSGFKELCLTVKKERSSHVSELELAIEAFVIESALVKSFPVVTTCVGPKGTEWGAAFCLASDGMEGFRFEETQL
jgi:hypothetical protein